MQLNPYLSFNGNCAEAFAFYEKALGGKILMKMTYADSPMAEKTPKELLNQVMHVRIDIGGKILMGSDAPSDRFQNPQGFHVTLGVETAAEAESLWNALSEKATITMPIAETFWATRFGMLIDQFGIPWMINCEKIMA
jgi:PhnB protein